VAGHVVDLFDSNMGILLHDRCISWFYLRKLAICLITLVTLLAVSVFMHTCTSRRISFSRVAGTVSINLYSHAADRRGPNQKIVTYSLYGNFSREDHVTKYVIPFGETLKSVPSIYPVINQYEYYSNDSKGEKL
jgi:hypothetical protein